MILTEKGSTRGTVSILFLSTIVLLAARFVVVAIENLTPENLKSHIAWHKIEDVLAQENTMAGDKNKDEPKGKVSPSQKRRAASRLLPLNQILKENTQHLPVLIMFTDDNSMICKNMEERSLSGEIRDLIEKKFYPIRISFSNVLPKTEYRLYQKYGLASVPQLVITTADGVNIDSAGGYLSAVKVCVFLKQGLKKIEKQEAEYAKEQALEKGSTEEPAKDAQKQETK